MRSRHYLIPYIVRIDRYRPYDIGASKMYLLFTLSVSISSITTDAICWHHRTPVMYRMLMFAWVLYVCVQCLWVCLRDCFKPCPHTKCSNKWSNRNDFVYFISICEDIKWYHCSSLHCLARFRWIGCLMSKIDFNWIRYTIDKCYKIIVIFDFF
jgi:hypothetical protein